MINLISLKLMMSSCKKKLWKLPLLTHLPLDKMAAILADDNFICIFFNEDYRIPIQI